MVEAFKEGYWLDKRGHWHKERRKLPERRKAQRWYVRHDRRGAYRRRIDSVMTRQDHQQQIKDALHELDD